MKLASLVSKTVWLLERENTPWTKKTGYDLLRAMAVVGQGENAGEILSEIREYIVTQRDHGANPEIVDLASRGLNAIELLNETA